MRERGTTKAVALFNEQPCGGGPSSPAEIMVQNANAREASSPARETSKDIWIIISQIRIFFFSSPPGTGRRSHDGPQRLLAARLSQTEMILPHFAKDSSGGKTLRSQYGVCVITEGRGV